MNFAKVIAFPIIIFAAIVAGIIVFVWQSVLTISGIVAAMVITIRDIYHENN